MTLIDNIVYPCNQLMIFKTRSRMWNTRRFCVEIRFWGYAYNYLVYFCFRETYFMQSFWESIKGGFICNAGMYRFTDMLEKWKYVYVASGATGWIKLKYAPGFLKHLG